MIALYSELWLIGHDNKGWGLTPGMLENLGVDVDVDSQILNKIKKLKKSLNSQSLPI